MGGCTKSDTSRLSQINHPVFVRPHFHVTFVAAIAFEVVGAVGTPGVQQVSV